MTEKKEDSVLERFWKSFRLQNWTADNTWTAGGKPVNVISGLKLKTNFDKIRTESYVALLIDTVSLTDLPILNEENSKSGKKANVRRVQVRLRFVLRDMITGLNIDEWYGEGIGESPDQHTSGSAYGMAYRNGIIYHFGIVDNGDETSDTETVDFTPDVKKAENTNTKAILENKGLKLPTAAPSVATAPAPTVQPTIVKEVPKTVPVAVPTASGGLTDATKARAKAIFMTAMKSGMEKTIANNLVASYNSAMMSRNESDAQAWIERYKGFEVSP